MRVGFITSSLSTTDGWGRYSLELITALKKHVEVKVIMSASYRGHENIESYSILPEPLSIDLPKLITESYRIKPYLRNCDIIHCLVEPYAPIVTLANISLKKPLIITAHGTYAVKPLYQFIKGNFLKYAYKKADRILCVSKFTKEEILKMISLQNICIIQNGVNYDKFQKYDLSNNDSGKIILSVGSVKPRKGYDLSIRAFAEVKKEIQDIKYYIVGSCKGVYYDTLTELVKKLNISKDVRFLGEISEDELIKLYYTSNIFVLTPQNLNSTFEGFGLVYLEANACGKSVVGTYGCGAEDAIINGYNGLLVPQKNPQKTAEAIKYLLNNPEVKNKMGENGRRRAKELSWENIAQEIKQIYENVIFEGCTPK